MAASSQYHRGAATPAPPSHYHPLPAHQDHLYASLANSWNAPALFSRTPASSTILHRLASPVQRPFAGAGAGPYFDYPTNPGPSDYDHHHHPPDQPQHHEQQSHQAQHPQHPQHQQSQPAWPADYHVRPQETPTSTWSEPISNETFPQRHLSYAESQNRPAEHSQGNPLSSTELVTSPDAPLFPQQTTLNSAPVARLLNYPNSDLNPATSHALSQPHSQPPLSWPSDAISDPSPTGAPHPHHAPHSGHHVNTLSSAVVLPGHTGLDGQTWEMQGSASSNTSPPVFHPISGAESAWPQVEPQPEQLDYMSQHHPSISQPHSNYPTSRDNRGRGTAPKKALARVPAAFVERQEKNKVSKRKGPLPEASRQKTHQMRKDKNTCLRCRFYKSGCDIGEPCQKCLKTEGNARSFKLPCIRERLEDASLVRHCNGRSNQEEGEFLVYDWLPDCQLYDMEIIWNLPGYGPISNVQPMRITFRQYHPQRPYLDTATNVWSNTDGQIKVIEQPPYAVYDTASLIPLFERYFSQLQPALEQWIFDRVRHDEVALLTYNEVMRVRAKKTSETKGLLDLVMRIQCLSVVSQGYGTVWTNNIPGIQEVDFGKLGHSLYEAYNRSSRDRPLPGAINHQMDVAALKYLKKLERLCVKELSAQMFKSKIKPWYELFLALYVLFWNMEYIHRGANRYIISKNGTAIHTQVSSVVSTQIKKWDFAFQVVIHHWIAVLRGYMPFKLARENPEELREKGHLDAQGFEYVVKVANIIDQIGFGQSTSPYIGQPSTYNSLSSEWIKVLFKEAGA